MTQPDGRRDVERALTAIPGSHPDQSGRGRWFDEVAQQLVDLHRVTALRVVPTSLNGHQCPARHLSQPGTMRVWDNGILIALDDEHRAAHATGELPDRLLFHYMRSLSGCNQHL